MQAMNIVLIRHAERHSSGSDALSAAGKKRAELLVRMFKEAGVSAIFTSEFTRTKQTAAPLAAALGLSPQQIASDPAAAGAQVAAAGPFPLVVGHSDTVPELIKTLGGPANLEIKDNEFDWMFVVTLVSGKVSTLRFRYISA
jgi:phosphohistidine phosphatase SixA